MSSAMSAYDEWRKKHELWDLRAPVVETWLQQCWSDAVQWERKRWRTEIDQDNRALDTVLVSQIIADKYTEFRIGQSLGFMQEALRQMYDRAYAAGYAKAVAEQSKEAKC